MKSILVICCLAALVGCQTTNPYPIIEFQSVDKTYPPVSVVVNDGQVYSETTCINYSCSTYVDETHLVIRDTIKSSGYFSRVDLNNAHDDIKIYVRFTNKVGAGDSLHFPKILLMAGTLFILPMNLHFEYEAQFDVLYKNEQLKTYTYSVESNSWASFFGMSPKDAQQYAAQSIGSSFLSDIQSDKILDFLFTSEKPKTLK